MNTPKTSKPTIATVKSFIVKNLSNLHVLVRGSFDGMTDCVEFDRNARMMKADTSKFNRGNRDSLGIAGVWFVGGTGRSKDWVSPYNDGGFVGFSVSNCCGQWTVAVPVAVEAPVVVAVPVAILPVTADATSNCNGFVA